MPHESSLNREPDCEAALAGEALQALALAVWVLDERGTVIIANRAWRSLTERATMLSGSQLLAAATQQLISRERASFSMRLSCGESSQPQYLLAKASRLHGDAPGYIITLEDIKADTRAQKQQ